MSPLTPQLLAQVASRILEDAACLFTEEHRGERPEGAQAELQACVRFGLPRRGLLVLRATEALAGELAANMLGVARHDPSIAGSAREALGELANILTGALLARLFGAGEIASIGIPEVGPAVPLDGASAEVTLALESGGFLDVAARLEDTPSR